ncbi:MAG: 4-hydroxyphenylpyruvate dioxygenase [Acidobacteriota bacterium]
MTVVAEPRTSAQEKKALRNPLGLKRLHHVEMWVGNAKQSSFYYRDAFGFSQSAYRGLETGSREVTSYVLEQKKARLILTTPMSAEHPINEHLVKHGDGVKDIAFEVEDADQAFAEALARGAKAAAEPHDLTDEHGTLRRAVIHTYGDTVHSLISNKGYDGPFMPGFVSKPVAGESVGLVLMDHMVGNVELGKMNEWADWYSNVLGFERYITFDDEDISTEYSALMSIVMSDDRQVIKFPINEPAEGRKKSQIDEYLDYYNGPGVQHIAMLTGDILTTVEKMRANGIEFLTVPDTYYDELPSRVGDIDEAVEAIRQLGILVDRDEDGYLLQIFTKPVVDRPTLFFEIIQRKGSRGFGKGNFKALFEAIELEQARRGNL